MSTSSDDVRGYIAGLEADRRALAEVRATIDVFRRNVLPDSSVTNRMETDAEVIARLAGWEKIVKRGLHDTEARANGIRLGLRAASLLVSDHDCGDEHDARLDALSWKILGTSAEEARSMVAVYEERAWAAAGGDVHRAPGKDGPWEVGEPVLDHLGREVGKVALCTTPKPCPLKDCNLPCDDGHKHLVEKTDEPRPLETTTIRGSKPIKLRVGQIWRAKDGTEIVVTIKPPSSLRSRWQLGAEAELTVDTDDTIIDSGGCTLVYDPRGNQ